MTNLQTSTAKKDSDRVNRPEPYLADENVMMAHGSGGKAMHALIESVFLSRLSNPLLDKRDDQAVFALDGAAGGHMAFTTDSFVISPLFFPGGNIGELAVNGTINDLAVAGARPLYLSAGFILEEGFPIADLRRIVDSMASACECADVAVVTGDTKVVNRGKGDGVFINTSGVGIVPAGIEMSPRGLEPGHKVIVNGSIGDHGIAITLAREKLDIEADIESDTAPLNSLVEAMLQVSPGIVCMRDATRGGVATVLNELADESDVGVVIHEEEVPVNDTVRAAAEILGIDPLHVANEGKVIAIVPGGDAEGVVKAMQGHPLGREAAIIGEVIEEPRGRVLLRTPYGGTRVLDMLVGDPLPRIC